MRSRQSPRRAELIRSLTRRVQDLDDVMQGMSQLFARRHGLNSTDLRVLMAVYRAEVGGRPLTAGQLAEGVRLSPAAVSYALGRLCESGHLHKEPDPEDGRRVLVRYSQAGLDAAVGFFGPLASVQADVLAGFSVEELDAANRVVAALVGGSPARSSGCGRGPTVPSSHLTDPHVPPPRPSRPRSPMVSIAQAARSTGVPAATLRVWERRYGVPCPERTGSGYRNYGPDDLAQIARMRDLVADGLGPAQAATMVTVGVAPVDPRRFVDRMVDADATDAIDLDGELAALLRSADLADQADEWLLPMLAEVGRRWAADELAIGAEHALTAAVARRLAVIWHELPEGTRTPTVLVGLPGGARHDITLFCFAVLLRREGYRVGYLGADLPVRAWAQAVTDALPCVVVTAVHADRDVAATEELVRAARGAGAGLVAVGGGRQDRVGEPVVRLGHAFGAALRRFSGLV